MEAPRAPVRRPRLGGLGLSFSLGAAFDQHLGQFRLELPNGIAVDPNGISYVADAGNHVIKKVLANGTTSTLVGTGSAGAVNDATAGAPLASFNSPRGIAINSAGTCCMLRTLIII